MNYARQSESQNRTDGSEQPETGSVPSVSWHPPRQRLDYLEACMVEAVGQAIRTEQRSEVALHCGPPRWFRPLDDKINVLYTSTGSKDLSSLDIPMLRQADAIIVPSKFCYEVFSRECDSPVYVARPGLAWDAHVPVKRDMPKKFRWLCLVANENYPSWPVLAKTWQKNFLNNPDMELYFKALNPKRNDVWSNGNVTWDTRKCTRSLLRELYYSSHAMTYFPSHNDGASIPLIDAISTGLPVLSTLSGSHVDFYNPDSLFIVDHVRTRVSISGDPSIAEDSKYGIAVVDEDNLLLRMGALVKRYDKASEIALGLGRRIREEMSVGALSEGIGSAIQDYVSYGA